MGNRIYGYARVSSLDQNESRQVIALDEFGVRREDIVKRNHTLAAVRLGFINGWLACDERDATVLMDEIYAEVNVFLAPPITSTHLCACQYSDQYLRLAYRMHQDGRLRVESHIIVVTQYFA